MIDNIITTLSSTTIGITIIIYYYRALKQMEEKYHNELTKEFYIEYFDTADEIDLELLKIYSE